MYTSSSSWTSGPYLSCLYSWFPCILKYGLGFHKEFVVLSSESGGWTQIVLHNHFLLQMDERAFLDKPVRCTSGPSG